MTEELDEKLVLLMEEVRDEWLERAFSPSSFDDDSVREFFKWLYLLNGSKAEVAILDSPLACQIAANILNGGEEPGLDTEVHSRLYDPLDAQMWDRVEFELGKEMFEIQELVGSRVRGVVHSQILTQVQQRIKEVVKSHVKRGGWQRFKLRLWIELGIELNHQIETQFRHHINTRVESLSRSSRLKFYDFGYHGDIGSYPWLAFYDFFRRLGVVKSELFNTCLEYMKNNIFASVQLEGVALVSRPPMFVHRNSDGRLHCLDGPAVSFADGYSQHYVEGIYFDSLLFEKAFLERNLTIKEFLRISNTEQKAIVLGYSGDFLALLVQESHRVIGELRKRSRVTGEMTTCRLIDIDAGGLRLRVLELEDHSTHKKTVIGVPRNEETSTIWKALRWSFPTEKQYYPDLES